MKRFQVCGAKLSDGSSISTIITAHDESDARDQCRLAGIAVEEVHEMGEPIDPSEAPAPVVIETRPASTQRAVVSGRRRRAVFRHFWPLSAAIFVGFWIPAIAVGGVVLYFAARESRPKGPGQPMTAIPTVEDELGPRQKSDGIVVPGVRIVRGSIERFPSSSGGEILRWTAMIENAVSDTARMQITPEFIDSRGKRVGFGVPAIVESRIASCESCLMPVTGYRFFETADAKRVQQVVFRTKFLDLVLTNAEPDR